MKRSKQIEGTLKYKNTGGLLKINGEFIKRNETFYAFPQEVPEAFMDTIICLDEEKLIEEVEKEQAPEVEISYTLIDRGNGWFDIVDQDGKKINEKGMRKPDAEEALAALQEG